MDRILKPFPRPPRRCAGETRKEEDTFRRRGRKHRDGIYGDAINRKRDDCVRLLFQNVGGIGFCSATRSQESLKLEKLKELVIDKEVDIVGLAEVNTDWRLVENNNSVWAATAAWKESRRIQLGFNTTAPPVEKYQVGGTLNMTFDEVAFRVRKRGEDERGLGRWSWQELQGINDLKTTIVTAYCPVKSSNPGGCYAQHLQYMSQHAHDELGSDHAIPETITCPRALFGYDLQKFLEGRIDQGQQIVLMGDFNSEYGDLREWMMDLGLLDIIGKKHGYDNAPKTYNRSKPAPIDCIFTSANMEGLSSGFLSFGKLVGDHRGLWVDIPKHTLFGCNIPPHTHPAARRLKLNDPRIVRKYLEHLHQAIEDADMYQRMNTLHARTVHPLPQHLADEYESIDVELCACMDRAEEHCRKFKTGRYKWSPAYQRARAELEYWQERLSHAKGLCNNVKRLQKLQRKLKIQYNPTLTRDDLLVKVKDAYAERQRCNKASESLNREYRHRLATAKEDAGNIKAATHLRNMNRIEAQRQLFRNIRYMEEKLSAGSTTQVTVTSEDGRTTELTQRDEVEKAVMAENERKFHQTEGGSQLLSDRFVRDIGKFGNGPSVANILEGTYDLPPEATDATKDFLNACQRPNNLVERPTESVVSRYWNLVKAWKTRKERTASANQHIGHYKAIMGHTSLSWLFFQRAEIPEISGYSPSRHRCCIDLMILKKAMSFDLAKQRTLGLLDSEFNHSNKMFQKVAMEAALDNNAIAQEQYSRPSRTCIDHAVNRRLTIDHHQSKRICLALAMSDLKGCYDRIIHNAAALALLRIGVSKAKIHSMFETIQRMVHRIRTGFGDATETYGGDDIMDWEFTPQGVLQGNASGPTIWSVLSSVIFEILHDKGFGVEFCSTLSKQLFLLVGFSYVDDCDLIQSGEDPITVARSMQRVIQQWGDLMEVTGGALASDKTYWYLVEFVWKRGKWIAADSPLEFDLIAKTEDNNFVSLNRLSCSTASEMLGIWMAPNGSKTKMIQEMRTSAVEWGAKIRKGRPSQEEAWQALHSTIAAKLKYPLAACTFTEKECTSIMAPAIRAALPKSGISRTMTTSVRDAPITSGGLGVPNLYKLMGTLRTALLVNQCWQKTPTRHLLHTCIEDMVLDTGLYGLLWHQNFPAYSSWTSQHSWIYHVCAFNYAHEIRLNIEHAELKPRREGDRSIMAVAYNHFNSAADLRAINRVRMLHGVVNISDITAADGRKLDQVFLVSEAFEGTRNDYVWPSKHHVTPTDYTAWRRAMEFLFPANLHLSQPLGNWIIASDTEWIDQWDWFLSGSGEFLYFRLNSRTWHRFLRKPHTHRGYHEDFLEMQAPPIRDLRRATVCSGYRRIDLLSYSPRSAGLPQVDNIQHRVGNRVIKIPQLPWTMSTLRTSPTIEGLLLALRNGTSCAVSDGSFYPNEKVGSAAWIIITPDGTEWIEGGGVLPGPADVQNSYRSELGGQVGIASCLKSLQQELDGQETSLLTACDNLGALNKVGSRRDKTKPALKSFDLITALLDIWNDIPVTARPQHVRGHQDDRIGPLTFLESLNVRMDLLAKSIAQTHIRNGCPDLHSSSTVGYGTITIRGIMICTNLQRTLYQSIHHQDMVTFLANHLSIDEQIVHTTLAWHSFRKARKECSFPMQKFISKWLSGDTATGLVMKRRKQRLHAHCPICGEDDEHLLHVLICPDTTSVDFRKPLLTELETWLIEEDTHPDITEYLMTGLTSWFDDPFGTEPTIRSNVCSIRQAASLQSQEIGWYAFLCGFIVEPLVTCQQSHYSSTQSRRRGERWAIRLIHRCWKILHLIWMHRNSALHESEAHQNNRGAIHLPLVITFEHARGLDTLHRVYAPYFRIPLTDLLTRQTSYQKQWFLLIRTAREAVDLTFSVAVIGNPSFRKWIGLLPRQ